MKAEMSTGSTSRKPLLEVRSWYLIGFLSVVAALLIIGECFALNFSMSGVSPSSEEQMKAATLRDDSHVLSHHSRDAVDVINDM